MKICGKCKIEKEVSEFTKNSERKDGLHGCCRSCKKEEQRAWYESHKQEQLKRVYDYKESLRDFIRETKEESPCTDCGIKYPYYVMDFDHLPSYEKKFNINCGAILSSKYKLLEEMAKCELVCSNCHRIRTFSRMGV